MANFNAFVIRQTVYRTDGKINCFDCDGSGWIWDPDSPRDCIEGNKMRNSISCPGCNRTKVGSLSKWKDAWKKAKKSYMEDIKRKKLKEAERKRILNKLTEEEIEFLGLLP
jgi:predicted Fe-S protein YdhL (DUF1289 family)